MALPKHLAPRIYKPGARTTWMLHAIILTVERADRFFIGENVRCSGKALALGRHMRRQSLKLPRSCASS